MLNARRSKRTVLALIVALLSLSAVEVAAQTTLNCVASYCPAAAPDPIANVRFVSGAISKKVLVKRPGSERYVSLGPGEVIPMGSSLNTRGGSLELIVAPDQTGRTETVQLWGGLFKANQIDDPAASAPSASLLAQFLVLGSQPGACGRATAASNLRARKQKPRLWGKGKGRFRTKANQSAATVRGTEWFVEERCYGTYTRVKEGSVEVRDYVKRKTVVVKAGSSYVAARKRPKS